ncbi:MAG: complex I NDUFA9 subunit family protein [Gammaproteobacteria bacterium]|nr:complex I NDUFA9 subunit family protein [Gammaproteobacteria bacterium]MBU6509928.1 complex I NDUFA9 subunit family protein [Gammaproteobacteria bacterium]MDE1984159.1 complex I NDUFA9 subunit family protein [Gammaproteobacteria bacterium]MDE2108528.1 complex I NDUFA9 subunit family protein [Gammaproteobacteria bacterium]MDE2459652.1 complex I NDUFA9 subunit family protein [Gammaproteobacteria bacterium]
MPRATICLLGGTGFVGRHLAARLAQRDYNVKILTRAPERHYDLVVLPTVTLVEADVQNAAVLTREFAGCKAVINLVGILNERGHRGLGFHQAHVELAGKVIAACRAAGATRLLHMSALNAARDAPSHYLRTKAEAAERVLAAGELRATVFEPSVIFGPGDSFTTRFTRLLRRTPGILPLACANARFAPAWVGDVAEALLRSLDDRTSFGHRYQLCGARSYTLRELLRYLVRLEGLHRLVIGLPRRLSWLQAALMEWLPGKPFSLDNYRSLQVDNVCSHNGFAAFGIEPMVLEAVVPTYLGRFTAQAELDKYRRMRGVAP